MKWDPYKYEYLQERTAGVFQRVKNGNWNCDHVWKSKCIYCHKSPTILNNKFKRTTTILEYQKILYFGRSSIENPFTIFLQTSRLHMAVRRSSNCTPVSLTTVSRNVSDLLPRRAKGKWWRWPVRRSASHAPANLWRLTTYILGTHIKMQHYWTYMFSNVLAKTLLWSIHCCCEVDN